VDEGAFAEDGSVGAVVINAAREVVWACYFDDGTCAPEEITLPEVLLNVPAPGEDGHSDWHYRREQHITHLLRPESAAASGHGSGPALQWQGRA
jgi:hypothetical protein